MNSKLFRNTICCLIALSCVAGPFAAAALAAPAPATKAPVTKPLPPQAALNTYMNGVHEKLMHAWHAAKSPHTFSTVRFRVYRTGQVWWVELTDASKIESANNAAEDAIASCTFAPMPASFPDYLDFSADFESELQTQNCDGYSRPVWSNRTQSLKLLAQATKLSQENDHSKSLDELLKALQLSPFDVRIKDALVHELLSVASKQPTEAAEDSLHQALLLDPVNKTAREQLHKLLKASGKDPANAQQRAGAAREYAASGSFDSALVEFGEAWLLSKNSKLIPEINNCLAQAKGSALIKKWQAAVASNGSAENHLNLANAYKACALEEKARVELEIAKKLGAESPATPTGSTVATSTTATKEDDEEDDDETKTGALASEATTTATTNGTQPGPANSPAEPAATEATAKSAAQPKPAAIEEKTLALTATPLTKAASAAATSAHVEFEGDFPYAPPGQRSLKLTVLKNRQVLQDYLKEACKDSVIRWASNRIPLTLYIDPGNDVPGFRPQFRKYMLEAFDAWQAASGGRIRYKLVGGPKGANIVCHWTNDPRDKRMSGNEQGVTHFEYMYLDGQKRDEGGLVRSAEITILLTHRFTKRILSDGDMKGVCLHELGHSFGIHGHSKRRSDIMYPYMNKMSWLSAADANTIVHLYQGYEHPRN